MGVKSFFKKFGQIALMEAPFALQAAGLPVELGSIITIGVTAAKGMSSPDNQVKAQEAAVLAKEILAATNTVLVARGHAPLVDEAISDDALAHALKVTYDIAKMKEGVPVIPNAPPS